MTRRLRRAMLIIGGRKTFYLFAITASQGLHEIATEEILDRGQRGARDAAGASLFGRTVEKERLEGLEEMPGGQVDGVIGLVIASELLAQFRQDELGARNVVTAEPHPLQF